MENKEFEYSIVLVLSVFIFGFCFHFYNDFKSILYKNIMLVVIMVLSVICGLFSYKKL